MFEPVTKKEFLKLAHSPYILDADTNGILTTDDGQEFNVDIADATWLVNAAREKVIHLKSRKLKIEKGVDGEYILSDGASTLSVLLLVRQHSAGLSATTTAELSATYRALAEEVHRRVDALEPWEGDITEEDGVTVLVNRDGYARLEEIVSKNADGQFVSNNDEVIELEEGACHIGDLITLLESRESAEEDTGQDYESVPRDDFRRKLHEGDEVKWNDPDDGLCSRISTIASIEYLADNCARISWKDGGETEVRLEELS